MEEGVAYCRQWHPWTDGPRLCKKASWPWPRNKPISSVPLRSASVSDPRYMALVLVLVSLDDEPWRGSGSQIYPLVPRLLWVMMFITATESQLGHRTINKPSAACVGSNERQSYMYPSGKEKARHDHSEWGKGIKSRGSLKVRCAHQLAKEWMYNETIKGS